MSFMRQLRTFAHRPQADLHCGSAIPAGVDPTRTTTDWVHSPGMPGPHHRLWGGASAPRATLLRRLLQRHSNSSISPQRCAAASARSDHWYPAIPSHSRRTSSRVRPNLVLGTHRIAFMEAIVAPQGRDHWDKMGMRAALKALRSETGEAMVLENNYFIEDILPNAILRKLSEEE